MRRSALLLATLFLLAGAGMVRVSAQEATPAPGLVVPDPAECTVAPRSVDDLAALLATPAAGPDAAAAATQIAIPLGQPADAATVEGVTRTVRETFACFNAGDFLRVLALTTDDFVRWEQAQGFLTAETLPFLEAPPVVVPPEQRAGYLAITDVAVLPDGRVGAFVVEVDPVLPSEGAETDYLIFEQAGDRWLLDEVVESWTLAEGEATPAP